MKLLYITNSRMPTEKAHGCQIVNTCHVLAKQGINLTLLLPKRFNNIKQDVFNYYKLNKNFTIKKIICLDLLWLPFFKKVTFLIQLASFTKSVVRFVKKNKQDLDIIYTRDFFIVKAMLKFDLPVFYEIHTMPKKIFNWHIKVWQDCKGLVVISNGLRDELIKQGIDKNKILVARDAVDLQKFDINISKQEAREKLNLPLNKKIVVYTGHLYSWKGADTLAKASEFLNNVEVYLVGGTIEDIKKFKNKYNYKNLHIIGSRSQYEIPIWLKSADLLILPNSAKEKISSHYTSPLKLFEYMASGVLIVASDLPSIKEIVNKDEVSFFTPDNVQSLVNVINIALIDKKVSEKTEKLKARVRQYSWQSRAKKIVNFMSK